MAIPLWVAKDRSPRLRYLRDLERTQYSSTDSLRGLQLEKLRALLSHAYSETGYYRRLLDDAGLRPSEVRSLQDLRRLPILTKEQIRLHGEDMMARSLRNGHLTEFKTGGSTGKPVTVFKDPRTVELSNASAWRVFRWAGWQPGEPWGLIWGNPPTQLSAKEVLLDHFISPEIYLDTMNLTDASMSAFVSHWHKARPTIMRGHSHSIFIFASFCLREGIDGIRPNAIISSSMMLLPSERRTIEKAFACKVTDLYGCEEVGLIACECEQHNGMHIDMENVLVEVIDGEGREVPPGETGALVVTSLIGKAMPMIRYRIGDMASISDQTCGCGRGLQLMSNLGGRVADFLVRQDGSVVAGVSLVERTLTLLPGIAQMQIVQESLDEIVLRIVRGPQFSDSTERALVEELQSSVGRHNRVVVQFVERIPQEASGKYRFAISKVPNPYGS